ncbi:MAG TPA: PspC domain-containing protein, partial [Acidimicrobiia bacterium]|nr:PspC domain-containing protein [Acidimicrobiia bacterium]
MTDTTRTRTTRPTRLQRSRSDRVLTGVAGGLGTHLGINPWWFRFAFLILTFFGGLGLVVYLAAWLVIPDEGQEDPIISNWLGHVDMSDAGTIFGLVLVGAAAVIVLTQFADISGTLVVAAILFVVGLLLYRGELTSKQPDRSNPDPTHGGDLMTETTTTAEKAGIAATAGYQDAAQGGEGDELPPVLPPAPPAYGEPDSGPTEPWEPPPPRERSMLGRLTLAVGLIVVATMALLDVAFTRVDMDPVHYLAAAVAVIGLGLLVGAFIGKALWLIIVGVLLLPALWIAALL